MYVVFHGMTHRSISVVSTYILLQAKGNESTHDRFKLLILNNTLRLLALSGVAEHLTVEYFFADLGATRDLTGCYLLKSFRRLSVVSID